MSEIEKLRDRILELEQAIADLQAQVEEHKANAESWRSAYVQQAWHLNLVGSGDDDDDDEDCDDDE